MINKINSNSKVEGKVVIGNMLIASTNAAAMIVAVESAVMIKIAVSEVLK